ncbi:homeobox protein NANOG isoform X2 [Lagenorhynchus albirostris]|uniref:homeobox protein NANOG-like isoform X2 n=1 Tax=Lagenorhynchus albirostris TaxID=27610 RepID=UPI0028EC5520|nr:homeobox protein NANOG-like isoform X2 [Lagenorhynchus albirostris]XP_060021476.1 homeobox protein NANOG isoform X2 [Lagenorhynchus albirostris]
MSVDPACPQSLRGPEASNSRESSPMPEIYGPEENYVSLQMSSAETHDMETVSPLPSFSMDVLIQDSPDSSTSPRVKLATAADKSTEKKEEKVLVKKQKTRTVFSQTQLCVLNDRFQRQKYLSLQQMQELSNILNLSYKQVKTWFQNQRMKCKRWQKNNWPRNSNIVTQGCLVNSSGNLPMWGNQTWNNPTWSNQSWNSQSWNNQSWNSQTWCPQAWNNQTWNNQFNNYVEEFLQPQIQYQQSSPVSDLEATLETAGEGYNIIQQTAKYFNSQQQIMDLFPNYSLNIQPEDL